MSLEKINIDVEDDEFEGLYHISSVIDGNQIDIAHYEGLIELELNTEDYTKNIIKDDEEQHLTLFIKDKNIDKTIALFQNFTLFLENRKKYSSYNQFLLYLKKHKINIEKLENNQVNEMFQKTGIYFTGYRATTGNKGNKEKNNIVLDIIGKTLIKLEWPKNTHSNEYSKKFFSLLKKYY